MELNKSQFPPILPDPLDAILDGYTCTKNKIGCSSASVYKYNKGSDSLYLKTDSSDSELLHEYKILCWLDGKLPVPKIKFWIEYDGVAIC
ncbi:MAG: hypothetical protein ACYCWE_06390 [Eubacteriales bacterium]